MILSGNIVDIRSRKILKGRVYIENSKIMKIMEDDSVEEDNYILPGLIDAHIHVESSMLIPSEFARLATPHGTVATVSDPHEIANVMGIEGVEFMIENGKQVPFKFYFGAPSCVPATDFETSGAQIDSQQIEQLLRRDDIKYLSEMMNFPGVLYDDKEVWAKLKAAKKYGKPIDGHAPGLTGKEADKYVKAGITTDHECFSLEEAIDKMNSGMFVQIREGSAAKNYHTLSSLIDSHTDMVMLCSDDKHPNDLAKGHMNDIIKRALKDGYDLMNILQCCIINPAKHYDLDIGMLQTGDAADLIIVDNLEDFHVLKTYINGQLVAENGKTLIESVAVKAINKFHINTISVKDIQIPNLAQPIKVMQAIDGELITPKLVEIMTTKDQVLSSNTDSDILKILVLNRYEKASPAMGFIKGFGFKRGAIASSVAHDSHNIVAVGVSDHDIVKAVNLVNESRGGVSWVDGDHSEVLELPVAGIMSHDDAYEVSEKYSHLDTLAKSLGTALHAPYMTLSFMALLVIPQLKLSDKGLFDGDHFCITPLEENAG